MKRQETLDQLRRILLLATGRPQLPAGSTEARPVQLELSLWGHAETEAPPGAGPPFDPGQQGAQAHAFVLELLLLTQMEIAGLVASPLGDRRRRRLGLGSDPPLRVLAEWERARPSDESPWMQGVPAAGREQAYAEGLGRVRALADDLGLAPARVREILRRVFALASKAAAEDDLPGLLLAHGARHQLRFTAKGKLAFQSDRDASGGAGAVYTPPEVAVELVDTVLGRELPAETPDVLDPACGTGQILLAAAQRIAGRGAAIDESTAAAARGAAIDKSTTAAAPSSRLDGTIEERLLRLRHLYGADLDPRAARVAAWNLSYWAARETMDAPAAANGTGALLDRLFGPTFPYFLGSRIQVGNALQIEPTSYAPGFIWETRFPAVFARPRPGFDVVLGNPPWVSHGLRERAAAPKEERLYYERLYPAGTQYKLSLYPIFMELALRLCRPGGLHAFLVPDSVLSGHHFSRIRRLLLSTADLLELALIEGGIWKGIETGHVLLYAARKKGGDAPAPVSVRNRVLRPGRPLQQQSLVLVPATQYTAAGQAALRLFRRAGEMGFLSRMMASPLRWRDVAWTYSGLIARYGQRSVQSPAPRLEFLLQDARGAAILRDAAALPRWRASLWSGGEVVPYRIAWKGGWIYWPDRDVARVYKSGFEAGRYENPKVFLRQTGDRLIAAADANGFFCFNNVHVLGSRERAGIAPLVLAGVLMSAPLQETYRILSLEAGRPLAQVDLKMIEALPYPVDVEGLPIGAGPLPPRSAPQPRRILRALERAVEGERRDEILETVAAARRAGSGAFSGGPRSGTEAVGWMLTRLLEMREAEVAAGAAAPEEPAAAGGGARKRTAEAPSFLQDVIDGVLAVLFQVSSVASSGAATDEAWDSATIG